MQKLWGARKGTTTEGPRFARRAVAGAAAVTLGLGTMGIGLMSTASAAPKDPPPAKGANDKGGDKPVKVPGNPPGNNGTVKIAELGDLDRIPNNQPHQGCLLKVQWYNFDEGADIISTVTFEAWSPTKVPMTVDGPATVFVGEDAASGAGNDFDGEAIYTLSFDGPAHPQQGYHVKLTINTPGSIGADKKHKVFWVEGCEDDEIEPAEPVKTPGDGEGCTDDPETTKDECDEDDDTCTDDMSTPENECEPVKPGTPTCTDDAATPDDECKPGNPNNPGTPAEPANPAEPNEPGTPAEPAEPAEPNNPTKPGEEVEVPEVEVPVVNPPVVKDNEVIKNPTVKNPVEQPAGQPIVKGVEAQAPAQVVAPAAVPTAVDAGLFTPGASDSSTRDLALMVVGLLIAAAGAVFGFAPARRGRFQH